MDSIAYSLHKSFKNIIFKNSPILSEIIFNWNDILGKNLCQYIYPKKIYFKKFDKKNVLLIKAINNNLGTEIYYQKNLIVERINNFFGSQVIDEVRLDAFR